MNADILVAPEEIIYHLALIEEGFIQRSVEFSGLSFDEIIIIDLIQQA